MTESLNLGKHILLTTFRRSGEGVATPVWTVPVSDGRVGMWTAKGTGKYKRMRGNPRVAFQPCSARGKVNRDSATYSGTVEIMSSGPLYDEVQEKIRAKYGRMIPLVKLISRPQGRLKSDQQFGDTVVLITPDQPLG